MLPNTIEVLHNSYVHVLCLKQDCREVGGKIIYKERAFFIIIISQYPRTPALGKNEQKNAIFKENDIQR